MAKRPDARDFLKKRHFPPPAEKKQPEVRPPIEPPVAVRPPPRREADFEWRPVIATAILGIFIIFLLKLWSKNEEIIPVPPAYSPSTAIVSEHYPAQQPATPENTPPEPEAEQPRRKIIPFSFTQQTRQVLEPFSMSGLSVEPGETLYIMSVAENGDVRVVVARNGQEISRMVSQSILERNTQ